MGNQASAKHIRGDPFKGGNINQNALSSSVYSGNIYTTNNQGTLTQTSAGGFLYPQEDLNEDYDCFNDSLNNNTNNLNTKTSYSPSDSVPTFKFPTRNEPIPINNINNNSMRISANNHNQLGVNNISSNGLDAQQQIIVIKKIPVVFRYQGKTAKDVYLIGTFTNWKEKILMVKSDGDFVVIVDLPEGEHQYKFVVDGKWEHDPTQASIDDNFNGKNNVVVVKKSDFEVMDALAMDSIQQQTTKTTNNADDLSRSPTGEYTDDIPIRGLNSISTDKPPYLPPQLLNIVLNKDTSASCEPALLPEPHHVMLKHLYALSIRDGVMVLSSTFRHKQKFITTCFYKPI